MRDWMPALRPVTILGDDGRPIPFGERWGAAGPPDDAYSRVTHPERYAQLHEVADALLAHLLATYECEAVEDRELRAEDRELRAVVVRAAPGTWPLRLSWTAFPGALAEVGDDVPAGGPICGCDACDETLERAVDALVVPVLDLAAGRGRGLAWPERP
ncbi:DUF6226 family protein [Agrococcus terreus]|uniref:Uncharacterized protein n=1 Tax=Agrococcus terreus TaxID=574649 RepID=A0ABQ2KPZ0_9MICO|nr:DUF6226 family protein [Agrococcus terreus]GGN87967.1 hypothetical protein GCM10010968_23040 [Agrococcus terreus]